jgi:hypothetical protein
MGRESAYNDSEQLTHPARRDLTKRDLTKRNLSKRNLTERRIDRVPCAAYDERFIPHA